MRLSTCPNESTDRDPTRRQIVAAGRGAKGDFLCSFEGEEGGDMLEDGEEDKVVLFALRGELSGELLREASDLRLLLLLTIVS